MLELGGFASEVERLCDGLCLQCIEEERDELEDTECTIKEHTDTP